MIIMLLLVSCFYLFSTDANMPVRYSSYQRFWHFSDYYFISLKIFFILKIWIYRYPKVSFGLSFSPQSSSPNFTPLFWLYDGQKFLLLQENASKYSWLQSPHLIPANPLFNPFDSSAEFSKLCLCYWEIELRAMF